MKKSPFYLKVVDIIAVIIAFFGLLIAFKIPGTIGLVMLIFALMLALLSFFILRKKLIKNTSNYLALSLSVLGIITALLLQTEEVEVAVDVKQEQLIEQTNETITEGDDLDDALDELEDF
jgi:Na+/proline symporter